MNKENENQNDQREMTPAVEEDRRSGGRLNFVLLIIACLLSGLVSIFVFVPIYRDIEYIYPPVPEEAMPAVEYSWKSIFSATFDKGNPIALILFFVAVATCCLSAVSIAFRRKEQGRYLSLASYLLFLVEISLFVASFVFFFQYLSAA